MGVAKFLLFPFSMIYGIIIRIRNYLFDVHILKQHKIQCSSICVGNLSVGGTGKTPMVVYLSNLLINERELSIVSRGYRRITSGFKKVNTSDTYRYFGDESRLYLHRFGDKVNVFVSEKRLEAVRYIENNHSKGCIILDDAFQHRHVKAGFSILMTNYSSLFHNDFLLPVGTLREPSSAAQRSDIIVVNKCPDKIPEEKSILIKQLEKYKKPVFISRYKYLDPVAFGREKELKPNLILVTGIANTKYMLDYLSSFQKIEQIKFKDHHDFSKKDIENIHQKFDNFAGGWSILTTEKDYIRLAERVDEWNIAGYPWFFLPIEMEIENKKHFNKIIKDYVRKN